MQRLVVGLSNGNIQNWDIATRKKQQDFRAHNGGVNSMALSPDKRFVLSGGNDRYLYLWNIATGEQVQKFSGHLASIKAVALSPDGRWALSGGEDNTMRLWEVSTGREIRSFAYSGSIHSIAFSPDSQYAILEGGDRILYLWEIYYRPLSHTLYPLLTRTYSSSEETEIQKQAVQLSKLARQQMNQKHWLDSLLTLRKLQALPGYARDNKVLEILNRCGRSAGRARGLYQGWFVRSFTGHVDRVTSVAFSPDGCYAISGSYDGSVRLWDVVNGKELNRFLGYGDRVTSVAFSPDGLYALAGGEQNSVHLWEISTGQEIWCFMGQKRLWYEYILEVHAVAFSPDGRHVIGSVGHTLWWWEIERRQDILCLDGGESFALSPDGRWALVPTLAPSTNILHVFDVWLGQEAWQIEKQTSALPVSIFCLTACLVALSPDGRHMLWITTPDKIRVVA